MNLLLIAVVGTAFVLAPIYWVVSSFRHLRGTRRIGATIGCTLVALGGVGFFGMAASSIGRMPENFEWPIGWAGRILSLRDGRDAVLHIPCGRVQVYDQKGAFVRGWSIHAGGGVFKGSVDADGNIEVWTARGQRHLLFSPEGKTLLDESYAPRSYAEFPDKGKSGYVRTPWLLVPFSHPFLSWGVAAVGMVLLLVSDPRWRKDRKAPY